MILSFFIFLLVNQYITTTSVKYHPGKTIKSLQRNINKLGFSILLSNSIFFTPAYAVGPVPVDISIKGYKQVELCDGKKPIMPGQKAMEGLFPVCIEVDAEVFNPKNTELTDVSVYGFIKDDAAGNSVLPNNPDFKSDGGQYAMIKVVPPGKSQIKYQFVAAVTTDPKKESLGTLTFFKQKAISFPGGDRFKALTECEIDPRADGCNPEDDE